MRRLTQKLRFVYNCLYRGVPVLATRREARRLYEEQGLPPYFAVCNDWARNSRKDSYYMHSEYIERCLALNGHARELMMDKRNFYSRCMDFLGREVLDLSSAGEQEALSFIRRHERIVAKQNFSVGYCSGLSVYDCRRQSCEEIYRLIKERGQDILEEYIIQHEALSRIYPDALSTLRIHTVNNGGSVRSFIKPKLRIGADGSKTDLGAGHGSYRLVIKPDGSVEMACYVDKNEFCFKAKRHGNSKLKFSSLRLLYINEAVELACCAARRYSELPYISWDVAISPDGPVLVEANFISGCFDTYQTLNFMYKGCGMRREIDEMLSYAEKPVPAQSSPLSEAGLYAHAKKLLDAKTVYLWGGLGEYLSPGLIASKAAEYPDVYTPQLCERLLGLCGQGIRGFDCSGLIKNYLMGGTEAFDYSPEQDMNSEMLLERAARSGELSSLPSVPGVCLYMPGHVGIYDGCGHVIEATSNPQFGNGVIKSRLDDRRWQKWFCCPGLEG